MSGIGYALNSTLHLGEYDPYFRIGGYLFDPSGRNANYLFKSLNRVEMKKYLMNHATKEEIVDMLLDFVEQGNDYQEITA